MKKYKLLSLMLCFCLCFAGMASFSAFAEKDGYYHGELEISDYWRPVDDNNAYDQYRLPGMVITKSGTLIVYGELRDTSTNRDDNNADKCQMDLYVRRSTDGGESFGERIWIAKGEEYFENDLGETIDNPVMIVGNDGRLHLLFCCDVGTKGVFYTYSDDDGVNWTEAKNIKSMLEDVSWAMLGLGPTHGVCLESGRLVVPAWLYVGGSYTVRTVYSDDNGSTWKLGQKASLNRDETAIAILSDGSVMLNSRQNTYADSSNPYRAVTVSRNGVDGWTTTRYDKTLIDPACEGSICTVDIDGLPKALLFVNCASKKERNNVTVRCSFDDGTTWEKSLLIDGYNGGYSDIAVASDGKVYVIYEVNVGARLRLATFSFYDEFCAGDSAATSYVTSFTSPSELIGSKTGISTEKLENGAVKATLTSTDVATAVFKLSGVTHRLIADKASVIALRVKASASADTDEVKAGVYFRCGSKQSSVSELYAAFSVPNDGEYHNVIIDMSGKDAYKGNIYSLEFAFCVPDGEHSVGDSFEIKEFGFFVDTAAATAVYPVENLSDGVRDTTDKPDEENKTDEGNTDSKSGCRSFAASHAVVIAVFVAAVATAVRSKPLTAKRKYR